MMQKAIFKLSICEELWPLIKISKQMFRFVYTALCHTPFWLPGHLGVIAVVVYLTAFLQPGFYFKLRQMLMSCYRLFPSRREQEDFVLFLGRTGK